MSSDKRPLRAVFPNFCPPCERRRSRQSVWGPDVIAVCGAKPRGGTHHGSRCPRPGRDAGGAARRVSAAPETECRARLRPPKAWLSRRDSPVRAGLGGGAAQATGGAARPLGGGRARVPAMARAQAPGPRRAVAFPDAAGEGVAPTRSRRIPAASREAPGCPARRPEGGRHRAIVQAT